MMNIAVQLIPWAKTESIECVYDLLNNPTLRVKVRAKPIDGEANKALLEALAKHFNVSKSAMKIIFGETSRTKVVSMPESEEVRKLFEKIN